MRYPLIVKTPHRHPKRDLLEQPLSHHLTADEIASLEVLGSLGILTLIS